MTEEEITKLARLARVELTSSEVHHLAPQIDRILQFAGHLSELSTDGVAPMATAMDVTNRLRDDEVTPGLDRDQALQNSPNHDESYFLVPPVLGPVSRKS